MFSSIPMSPQSLLLCLLVQKLSLASKLPPRTDRSDKAGHTRCPGASWSYRRVTVVAPMLCVQQGQLKADSDHHCCSISITYSYIFFFSSRREYLFSMMHFSHSKPLPLHMAVILSTLASWSSRACNG